jgi:hypothetical protein
MCRSDPVEPMQKCDACHEHYEQVYASGWTCLNTECTRFDDINTEVCEDRPYTAEFLKVVPSCGAFIPKNCIHAYPVDPAPADGVTTSSKYSRGFHCECGRMSSRFKWDCYECLSCGVWIVFSHLHALAHRPVGPHPYSWPDPDRK